MAQRPAPSRRAAGSSLDSEPDTQIGEFIRGKEIGKGSFATVYLAAHRKKRSYAAVKAVVQGKLSRKLKDNLDSEIRILKGLQHPHIVALFTCIETPAYIYLVMEYCQLSDLAQFMKKREQLPSYAETKDIFQKYPNTPFGLNEVLVRHFVKQIASAVDFLRQRNLIHRDIKPQNLLLNPSPTYMARQKPEDVPLAASEQSLVPRVGVDTLPMLKIADFGFARHLQPTMMAETLCGSPLYMAPEILSYQKYDAKADLWSIGTVAYEMMAGKPPFRAANHIELLRKIDNAEDAIPFPSGLLISSDLKKMIRSLLKRQPTERISFEGFFRSTPVVGPIPGLVGEDLPRVSNMSAPDPGVSEISRRMRQQAIDSPDQQRHSLGSSPSGKADPVLQQVSKPSGPARTQSEANPSRPPATMLEQKKAAPTASTQPVDIKRPSRYDVRPAMVAHATAPAREYLTQDQYSPRNVTGIRTRQREVPSPSTSAPREQTMGGRVRPSSREKARLEAQEREKTAQDIAFEKEYVMIEKRAVEVNAFADELAASPHISNRTSGQHNAMIRRATTQGYPTSTTGAQAASPSNEMQLATGRRFDASHNRQPSFERRYAPNPSSATNMLSKALNMANARLFGALGASPPMIGKTPSPPPGYGAFPTYPTPSVGLAITDGKDPVDALDEDARMLQILEKAATRSDTVYSFAEVKYRQLLPATPSADDETGIRQIGALERPLRGSQEAEDEELTQMAVVAVSEEALVLFVKALSVLAKAIDLASYWWSHHRRKAESSSMPPSFADHPSPRSTDSPRSATNIEVSRRMNNVVQWARGRFNECFEKSEIVGRRLTEAQKQLPPNHPGHPSNHQTDPSATAATSPSSAANNTTAKAASVAAGLATSADNIQLTTGVTAEKLMFDRAVEMSRAAAVNELVGEDLRGCEIAYRTAIVLLEAVLESDDEPLVPTGGRTSRAKTDDEVVNGMEKEERRTVLTLIEGTRIRLKALLRKIQTQMQAEKEQRRLSAVGKTDSRGSPSPTAVVGSSPR